MLLRHDLRPESVTARQVKLEICAQLDISHESLLCGLRSSNTLSPTDASVALSKLAWSVMADLSDFAWREFLFDKGFVHGGCVARKRSSKLASAVLFQCGAPTKDGCTFCALHQRHSDKNVLQYGIWSSTDNSLDALHPSVRKSIVSEAQRRAKQMPEAEPTDVPRVPTAFGAVQGFNVPSLRACAGPKKGEYGQDQTRLWRGSKKALRQRAAQPDFLDTVVPGNPREFSTDMLALPAHPCRLCSKDFATLQSLQTHIQVCHKGMAEYRKRLWYEASGEGKPVRPVKPQIWRLTSATMVEELVSGTSAWPPCAATSPSEFEATSARILGRLASGIRRCGGILAFMQAVASDSHRLAGERLSSLPAQELCALLLDEPQSMYKQLLLGASQKVGGQEPEDVNLRRFILLCDRARWLPVDDFWWDEGYVLDDLARNFGLSFRDTRLADLSQEILDAQTIASFNDTKNLSRLLQFAFSVNPPASSDIAVTAQNLRARDESLCMVFSDQFLANLVGLLHSSFWDARCLHHEGMALRLFAQYCRLAISFPAWTYPTKDAPLASTPWWVPKSNGVDKPVALDAGDSTILTGQAENTVSDVPAQSVSTDALGGEGCERRCQIRHRQACCVCARAHWGSELKECYMFDAPPGHEHEALLRDTQLRLRSDGDNKETQSKTRLSKLRALFSPQRYRNRWKFPGESSSDPHKGIPLAELEASAVRSPIDGKSWLLHRKAFQVKEDGTAMSHQKVPICGHCHAALSREEPRMPKFALPNDLWIGKLPKALRGLSEAAWILLALARVSVRRYNCLNDSGKWLPKDQQIKAIVGNVCAYPQADGGSVLQDMPPSPVEIAERLQVCFTGPEKDATRAYIKDLAMKLDDFKTAYEFLKECNSMYAFVRWQEANAEQLQADDLSGMPKCFAACMRTYRGEAFPEGSRQEGPAEAVEKCLHELSDAEAEQIVALAEEGRVWCLEHGGPPRSALDKDDFEDSLSAEEKDLYTRLADAALRLQRAGNLRHADTSVGEAAEEILRLHADEEWEACIGVADEDMRMDSEKQWQQIEAEYKRILAGMHANLEHELAEQQAAPSESSAYKNEKRRADLRTQLEQLTTYAKKHEHSKTPAEDAKEAERRVEQRRKPPGQQLAPYRDCTLPELAKLQDSEGHRLLVPSATQPLSMFDAHFWPCAFPRQFPYGDGGFGLERDVEFTLEEYLEYILQREELEYPDPDAEALPHAEAVRETPRGGGDAPQGRTLTPNVPSLRVVPRWRERDYISGLYCYWRRRAYIRSARLFANRQQYTSAMKDLGSLDPDDLFEAVGHLKKGQGTKELLTNSKVSPRVKACLRSLQISMNNVLGTNAHRTFLRHVVTGYRNLWGAPLLFTTMNVADTKHPIMKLLYDGGEVCAWRLLEDECPSMGSAADMMRRVSSDPVSQAIFTDLMMRLFLKHMLGVRLDGEQIFGDGVASTGASGLFGDVQAFFAPLESQGRGGLHAHMCVWILHPISANLLDRLRHGELGDEWQERLRAWREEVLAKVSTMQFDSVEEIARQTGCDAGEVAKYRIAASPEAAMAKDFYVEKMQEAVSVDAYLRAREADKRPLSTDDQNRLLSKAPLGSTGSCEFASPGSQLGNTPSAAASPGEGSCATCGSSTPCPTCPACRPVADSTLVNGFLSWHCDLPWRGLALAHDDARLDAVLRQASKCDPQDVRRLALLASVEWYCRSATWSERLACSGTAANSTRQELLLGAVSLTLDFLRSHDSELPTTEAITSDAAIDDLGRSFLRWHKELLREYPSQEQEECFLGSMRDSSTGLEDSFSCPMAALCLVVACYAVEVDATVDFVRTVFAACQKYAAGLAVRTLEGTVEATYSTWRLKRIAELERDVASAPEVYAAAHGLTEGDIPPLPLTANRQRRTCTDGAPEQGELLLKDAPVQHSRTFEGPAYQDDDGVVIWRDGPALEVPRQRPYAPVRKEPPDGRGDMCSECPPWRRLPPYASSSSAGGRALILLQDPQDESSLYARTFARDARRGYIRSHIHKCKKTCFKNAARKNCPVGSVQTCRFNFVHGRYVLWLPRRWPGKLTPCKAMTCEMCKSSAKVPLCGITEVRSGAGNLAEIRAAVHPDMSVHDGHCPADVPVGVDRRVARLGKKLVLPRGNSYAPHVCLDECSGGIGRILALRYHPDCSSSHPALQVCFRCNFDVQCMDRVFVCTAHREVLRRRRVKRSEAEKMTSCDPSTSGQLVRVPGVQGPQVTRASDTPAVFIPKLRGGGGGLDDPEDDFNPGDELDEGIDAFFRDEAEADAPPVSAFLEPDDLFQGPPDGIVSSSRPRSEGVGEPIVFKCSEHDSSVRTAFEERPDGQHVSVEQVGDTAHRRGRHEVTVKQHRGGLDDLDDDFNPGDELDEGIDYFFRDEADAPPLTAFLEPEDLFQGASDGIVASPRPGSGIVGNATVHKCSENHVSVGGAFEEPPDGDHVSVDHVGDMAHRSGGNEITLKIHRHWSNLIAAGRKVVECRVDVGRASRVQDGDTLILNDVRCDVVRVRRYRSFRAMLLAQKSVDDVTPGLGLEDAINVYHGFQDYETLAAEHGVVTFDLELSSEQPAWRDEKPVVMLRKELEEIFVAPEAEHEIHWDKQRPWWQSAYDAFKRAYRAMGNVAHYQTDYATKSNPMIGRELSEQCVGIERLRKEEIRDCVEKLATKDLVEAGRKTLIRLQTAANRAALKKLPEMVFQMLFKHECYQSHRPWTIFCKGLTWDAFCASHWQKLATDQKIYGAGWTGDKASLMDVVRQTEADYPGLEPEGDENLFAEQDGRGSVYVAGQVAARARRRDAKRTEKDDDDEEDSNGNRVCLHISPDRSMKQDWLYRGDRQPLASMGLYHYAMFVYTTHIAANSVPGNDFFTYPFADGHPDAATRVQKLRVHDLCRVPKIMGFTMPREDGAVSDVFRNTLFKSALFRPLDPVDGASRKDELAAAMVSWVDAQGSYAEPWKRWWDNQGKLAQQYEDLQRKSQRLFTLADIGCHVGYLESVADRRWPSAAEFMAHITVEAATNLEIGAQARSGRSVCPEFDSGDFGFGGGAEAGGGFAPHDGDDEKMDKLPLSKQAEALHPVCGIEARNVALSEDNVPEPTLLSYFKDFDQGIK